MAKITDPSRLLPSTKSTSIVKISKNNLSSFVNPVVKKAIVKDISTSKQDSKSSNKDIDEINNKLLSIKKFLESDLLVTKKKSETKRKEKEKQDFDEAEKKLETKETRKIKAPSLDTPSLGFFDRIKRFLFFTALGWLVPKLIEFLPKLQGVAKIIGGVYKFAEGLFGKLFDGFMSLVKFGGDLKNKTLGFIAQLKGGDYNTEFKKLENQFNNFINISIIAGVLSADIGLSAVDEYNKWRKKNAPEPKKGGGKPPIGRPKVTEGRGGKPPTRKPKVTTGKGGKVPGWWNRIFKGPFAKLKGPLSKFAGAAVPGLGAAVGAADAAARFKSGDNIGGALASVSAGLDTITTVLALTGVGLPAAAIFGTISIGIDVILLIRDIAKAFFPFIPMFSKGGRVLRKYQGGGTTKGGRPVGNTPRRTITPAIKKPPKIKPPKTQPGKDVGGEKKIKEFYRKEEKPETTKDWFAGFNIFTGKFDPIEKEKQGPYNALTKTSEIFKDLPFGIGHLMGGAVDATLGQAMDVKKAMGQFSSGISYLVETLANQRVNKSMSSLMSQIRGFAEGGTVPTRELRGTYSDISAGDLIAKVLEPSITQKVNEAIQSIEKELLLKGGKKEGGETGPSGELLDGGGFDEPNLGTSEMDLFKRMVYAEAGGEGLLGMALVARSILNRSGLIQSGKVGSGTFNSKGGSITEVITANKNGGWQYSPMGDGRIRQRLTESQLNQALRAIELSRDPVRLKELLKKERLSEDQITKLMASTGFRNYDAAGYDASQDVNETNFQRHTFNTAGNPSLLVPKSVAISSITIPGKIPKADYIKGVLDESGEPGFDVTWKGNNNIAVLPGMVKEIGPLYGSGYGNVVVVESIDPVTGKKVDVMYAHFPDGGISVRKDQQVNTGQVLGRMGKPGERGIGNISGQHASIDFYEPNSRKGQITGRYSRWQQLSKEIISGAQTGNNPSNWPKPKQQPPRPPSNAINTSGMSNQQIATRIRNIKPGEKLVFTGIGSVQGGRDWLGRLQTKYFDPQGRTLTEAEFIERFKKKSQRQSTRKESTRSVPKPTLPGRLSGGTLQTLQQQGFLQRQGGGLISPSKSNLPIPNSFASYESPSGGMLIAIQPMIEYIEKPSTSRSIDFPVLIPVPVNSSTPDLSLSRG